MGARLGKREVADEVEQAGLSLVEIGRRRSGQLRASVRTGRGRVHSIALSCKTRGWRAANSFRAAVRDLANGDFDGPLLGGAA